MTGFLDTSHLEDLRISLCENTTVFLSSPALKGRLHLDTFIINDRCGSLTTINELFTTLKPGLRFLAYQVGVTPNTESAPRFVKPYDGSEFPFDCDVISRNRDILKYLSHRVQYEDAVCFQPPEQADNYFESKHRCTVEQLQPQRNLEFIKDRFSEL